MQDLIVGRKYIFYREDEGWCGGEYLVKILKIDPPFDEQIHNYIAHVHIISQKGFPAIKFDEANSNSYFGVGIKIKYKPYVENLENV